MGLIGLQKETYIPSASSSSSSLSELHSTRFFTKNTDMKNSYSVDTKKSSGKRLRSQKLEFQISLPKSKTKNSHGSEWENILDGGTGSTPLTAHEILRPPGTNTGRGVLGTFWNGDI